MAFSVQLGALDGSASAAQAVEKWIARIFADVDALVATAVEEAAIAAPSVYRRQRAIGLAGEDPRVASRVLASPLAVAVNGTTIVLTEMVDHEPPPERQRAMRDAWEASRPELAAIIQRRIRAGTEGKEETS